MNISWLLHLPLPVLLLAVVAVLLSRQQGGSLSEKDQGETQPSLPASHEQHES